MGDTVQGSPGLVIDGTTQAGGDGTYPVTNPVRPAEVVLEAPAASAAQLDQAVAAARRAWPAWAALDHDERAAAVITATKAAGAAIADDQLDRLLTREHGKVLWEANFDSGTIGAMAEAFAPLAAEAMTGRRKDGPGPRTEVRHEPHGVVAALLPFNWPVAVMANKILPALLTGNTVVVKAPPTCPGAVLLTAAVMAAQLPPGVLNVLNGPGPELGAALVAHPGVDMVSFTGGVPTGRAVMASAAGATKPVVLELGGNDAAILAPDIAFDAALADQIVGAAFVTSGQVCMAIKRLYVHEDRLDDAVDALAARLGTEVIGDGLADGVTMGPVHRPDARDRVERFVAQAEQLGAAVKRPGTVRDEDKGQGGYLVNPALVIAPPIDSDIVVEEQFAPALPLIPYKKIDDAVAQANATDFGLCASVWSHDADLATTIASQLEAGTVFVNTHGMSAIDYTAPMGGWKHSGFGVELGPEGFGAFTRQKVVLTHDAPGA
jgi:acyl-CoA reductase-like NAD-dependent aldehyde dehydrogenase